MTFIVATLFLVLLFAASIIPALAADNIPSIKVGNITAQAGDVVEVPVTVENNPGFNAFSFELVYDDTALTLESVTPSPSLGGQFYASRRLIWVAPADYTADGEILTLKFKVNDNSAGEYKISILCQTGNICNYNEEDVNFTFVEGAVTTAYLGDVNGDGKINLYDLQTMKYILAGTDEYEIVMARCDIDGDSRINLNDLADLKKLLAGA